MNESGLVTGAGIGTTQVVATFSSLSGSHDAVVTENADDRMKRALRDGNPDIVSQRELLDQVTKSLAKRTYTGDSLLPDGPITWTLERGSMLATSMADTQQPLLTGTKNLVKPTDPNRPLAVVGTAPTQKTRLAYFGANPFITDLAAEPQMAQKEPGMGATVENTVAWLLGKQGTSAADLTGSVVLANASDGRDKNTRAFLTEHFPKLTVNGGVAMNGACDFDGTTPNPCLAGASVLLVGDHDNATYDAKVLGQVVAAYQSGIPLLFFSETGDYRALSTSLANRVGLQISSNYFQHNVVADSSRADQFPSATLNDALTADANEVVRRLDGHPLAYADYETCVGPGGLYRTFLKDCVDKPTDGAKAYMTALTNLRKRLASLDGAGTGLFDNDAPPADSNETLRVLALLADKQRTGKAPSERPDETAVAITYPVDQKNATSTTQALFADWFLTPGWSGNSAAAHQGTVYCGDATLANCPAVEFPAQTDHTITVKATGLDEWTATGFTLEPGKAGTVTLQSDPGYPVYVRAFSHRVNTPTGEIDAKTSLSRYTRPQFLASSWVRLTPGVAKQVSYPYGGPLYIRQASTATDQGKTVSLTFDDVSQHPAVLNVDDSAQIERFAQQIGTTKAFYTDLVGEGFEIHSTVDRLRSAFSDTGVSGNGILEFYNGGATGVSKFLGDVRDVWYKQELRMAGLKLSDQTLEESLPADVQRICRNHGWPCTVEALNKFGAAQHVNVDLYKLCGDLCAGNPIDAGGVNPFGWGLGHELGHNLQRAQLNTSWVDTKTGTDTTGVNDWSKYQDRAQEVSNNIFPAYVQWTFVRKTRPARGGGDVDDPLHAPNSSASVDVFAASQSANNRLTKDGKVVLLAPDCTVRDSYPGTATPKGALSDSFWSDSAYAVDGGPRLAFYLGWPIVLEGRTMADGTVLNSGPDVYTALYSSARAFTAWSKDAATWEANRDSLGFSLFPYEGDPTYGGNKVSKMIGNDYLLVQLSNISGYDFRPYFDAHGVYYTNLASRQVDENAPAQGLKGLGKVTPVVGRMGAPLDLSSVRLADLATETATYPGVDVDGRQGDDYVDFTPRDCAGVTPAQAAPNAAPALTAPKAAPTPTQSFWARPEERESVTRR